MTEQFSRARRGKDGDYDGQFFFGVTTTGIFCRPSCPAPVAKERHVRYFRTVFEALEQGFRPCLRCRPDIYTEYDNGNPLGADVVRSALEHIYGGYLQEHSVEELAENLLVSARHLRKLFLENLGTTPGKVNRYHKALFARRLVLSSDLPFTDVAFAAGFGSIRQFNAVFRQLFKTTPTDMRKQAGAESGEGQPVSFGIGYTVPFHFSSILEFLRLRAIEGIELVESDAYSRTFRTSAAQGYFTVRDNPARNRLEVTVDCTDVRCYMQVYSRIRKMFDVNRDFTSINRRLGADMLLASGMVEGHVPRLPVAWDPFEFVVRAVLGQQISVRAATTIAGRIAVRAGIGSEPHFPPGLDRFFPVPEEFRLLDLEGTGVTKARQQTLERVASAVADGELNLGSDQRPEEFRNAFSAIKGIGDWTVQYVAMRGLGMVDAFPDTDLGIVKAMSVNGVIPGRKDILQQAEKWRPYRSYAALCLWSRKPDVVESEKSVSDG